MLRGMGVVWKIGKIYIMQGAGTLLVALQSHDLAGARSGLRLPIGWEATLVKEAQAVVLISIFRRSMVTSARVVPSRYAPDQDRP